MNVVKPDIRSSGDLKTDAMSQTYIVGAGGNKSPVHPVMAKVAFLGDTPVFVKCNRIIRTGIDTGPASRTQIVIHDDNIVFSFIDSLLRTGLYTWGIITVPTHVDLKTKIHLTVNQLGSFLMN